MLKARDIMTQDVITVSPSTTIGELARILVAHKISGVPVVNDEGELTGVVTENDLINQNKRLHIPTIIRLFDAYIVLKGIGAMERDIRRMTASTVGEICTANVITVSPDATVEELATIMSDRKIHLIPVVEGTRLVGIIGKADLIRSLART